jgi:hypothetical protein
MLARKRRSVFGRRALLRCFLSASISALALGSYAELAYAGGFDTISFSGGEIQQTLAGTCTPAPNTVSLFSIAASLRSINLRATVAITPSRIANAPYHTCTGAGFWRSTYLNWSDMASLRDTDGWTFVPRGLTGRNLTTITSPTELNAEVCGALKPFYDHGQMRAWGLFAWPQSQVTSVLQSQYAVPCYAYGRFYAGGYNRLPIAYPYFANVASVNGGKCADPALACHYMHVLNNRSYVQPSRLIYLLKQPALSGGWTLIQWYKLVQGQFGTPGQSVAWNCTSNDPRDHWTSYAELYCYNDFLLAIQSIPPTIVVTDPASVAQQSGGHIPATSERTLPSR